MSNEHDEWGNPKQPIPPPFGRDRVLERWSSPAGILPLTVWHHAELQPCTLDQIVNVISSVQLCCSTKYDRESVRFDETNTRRVIAVGHIKRLRRMLYGDSQQRIEGNLREIEFLALRGIPPYTSDLLRELQARLNGIRELIHQLPTMEQPQPNKKGTA